MRLEQLHVDEYVNAVLPQSAPLWAGTRSLERYEGDLRSFVASGYGRRRFRLVGLREEGAIATSCKRYERDLRCGQRSFRAVGLGAVFTPEQQRGRGLATTLIMSILDAEQKNGTDFAFLFSDIRPHFYEELGFVKLPSRLFTLRAGSLEFARIDPFPIGDDDWTGVARCFAALERRRPFALTRTPLVWEWIRANRRARDANGDSLNLAVRSGKAIVAYCFGRRIVKANAFVVDEFAYAGEAHRALVGPLLRAAAGDLEKITGWLPPEIAGAAVPRGSVRPRRDAVLMIAPLSAAARERWAASRESILAGRTDPVWSSDHI